MSISMPVNDNARYYAMQITASPFLDKPRDTSASIARSCKFVIGNLQLYHAIPQKRYKPKLL